MSFTKITKLMTVIASLGTKPQDRPLTTDQFKAKFDEEAESIKGTFNTLIDDMLATTNGKGASQIGIEDSGTKFTATNVEDALAEIVNNVSSTASGKGASLVGIQDSGNRYSGTTVEVALAEIAGSGRTTETVKATYDALGSHTSALVTGTSAIHGLKIEEGTWTPSIAGTTTAGTHTYSTQQGKYYKVGKLVVAFFSITMTAKDASMAGVASIKTLPFTADNLAYSQGGSITRAAVIDIPTSYNSLALTIPASSDVAYISIIGDGVIADVLTASGILATTAICGTLIYKTA